ncbi:MAG: hypothetical protein PHS46_08225 [Candidatus Omnitrophica bacterium]|nr:hypothetical protein [Candidatus Omnitrophota bacterium]
MKNIQTVKSNGETTEIPIRKLPKLRLNFYEAKAIYNNNTDCELPVVGRLYWVKPEKVLWLYSTSNEESYEGHQTQFGIDINGVVWWGYFSHCSCYSYDEYDGSVKEFVPEDFKCYELTEVAPDILLILAERIKKLNKVSKRGVKHGA